MLQPQMNKLKLPKSKFQELKAAYMPKDTEIQQKPQQQQQQPLSTGFGSGFGGSSSFSQPQQSQQQLQQSQQLSTRINKECKFHIKLHDYEKNDFDAQYWGPIIGSSSLETRYDQQAYNTAQYRIGVQRYHQEIMHFVTHFSMKNKQFEELYSKQVNLRRRFLRIMKQVEMLRCKGKPIQTEEEEMSEKLHSMKLYLSGGPERHLEILKLKQAQLDIRHDNDDNLEVNDLNSLKQRLRIQGTELEKLIKMVNKDKRDLDLVQNDLK